MNTQRPTLDLIRLPRPAVDRVLCRPPRSASPSETRAPHAAPRSPFATVTVGATRPTTTT